MCETELCERTTKRYFTLIVTNLIGREPTEAELNQLIEYYRKNNKTPNRTIINQITKKEAEK